MAGRGADDHRDRSDRDPADTMPQNGPPDSEPLSHVAVERGERRTGRALVDLVVERDHAAGARPFGPNGAGEQHDATESRSREFTGRRGEGDRATGQAERSAHPPPYGGWIANSSPGWIRAPGRSIGSPLRTSRLTRSVGAS